MDVHEVTNAQFATFVEATDYVTTAEKAVDWDEIKKELPPGTPKVNAIFGSIPILSKEISNIKKGEPIPVNQFSDGVTQAYSSSEFLNEMNKTFKKIFLLIKIIFGNNL